MFVLNDFTKVLQISCLLSLPLIWLCSVGLLTLPVKRTKYLKERFNGSFSYRHIHFVIAFAIKMKLFYTRLNVAK